MSDQNEHAEEIKFRCSPIAVLPLIIFFIAFIILGIYQTFSYPSSIQYIELFTFSGKVIYLPIPIFLIIPLLMSGCILHTLYDAVYVIGEDYIRATYGLLSFQKKDIRLEFVDVRGIEINRGIYGRIANTGSIFVGTAMKEDEELFIENVFNPSQYRDLIIKRRSVIEQEFNHHKD